MDSGVRFAMTHGILEIHKWLADSLVSWGPHDTGPLEEGLVPGGLMMSTVTEESKVCSAALIAASEAAAAVRIYCILLFGSIIRTFVP